MNEIWKDIQGYEGWYQVSNLGNIKSLKRIRAKKSGGYMMIEIPKLRKPHVSTNGYCDVGLHAEGKSKSFTIHRLVANAFIDNPQNKPQINHKDGNKQNNAALNLEWVTPGENMTHAHNNGLMYVSRRGNNGKTSGRGITG